MPVHVVILGAGFGGLELATKLSRAVADQVRVTIIDQSDAFVFGFKKLDVMFGLAEFESVKCHYRHIDKPSVEFRQERVTSIDPETRTVVTDAGRHQADILVVALGADLDPGATPGFVEAGHEFYSSEGAARVARLLGDFDSGAAVIGVLGPFFKCPPAPNETAFMLHDYLVRRGVRDDVTIHLLSPLPMPIPISHDTSSAIVSLLEDRGIVYWPGVGVTHLDPATKTAYLADGRSLDFDLFLGVPVHRAPPVVEACGLTEDGWIPVDPVTFATRFPDVYAVGDVTSAPVPRAGIIAEGEAATLADVLVARIESGVMPPPYKGIATCYVEMGDGTVGRVDVEFLSGPAPTARFSPPSLEIAEEKRQFGVSRTERWFGPSPRGDAAR
ncbi:MAG TPA: FAD-dependent oxidoreductase [Acidimicrobiales bacterium]|nr:FAD-dependent oxidoreductase [Acidimicrobiales bacterium]